MMYSILETISAVIYSTVAGILKIEEKLINFMLTCFLSAIKIICHPIIILPLICATIYVAIVVLPERSTPNMDNSRMLVGSRINRGEEAIRIRRLMDKDDKHNKREQ